MLETAIAQEKLFSKETRAEERSQLMSYLKPELNFPYVFVRGAKSSGKTSTVLSVLEENNVRHVYVECKLVFTSRQLFTVILRGLGLVSKVETCVNAWALADAIVAWNPSEHNNFCIVLDHCKRLGQVQTGLLSSLLEICHIERLRSICRVGFVLIDDTSCAAEMSAVSRKATEPLEVFFRPYTSAQLRKCLAHCCRPVFAKCLDANWQRMASTSPPPAEVTDDMEAAAAMSFDDATLIAGDLDEDMKMKERRSDGLQMAARHSANAHFEISDDARDQLEKGTRVRDSVEVDSDVEMDTHSVDVKRRVTSKTRRSREKEAKAMDMSKVVKAADKFASICVKSSTTRRADIILASGIRLLADQRKMGLADSNVPFDTSLLSADINLELLTGVSTLNIAEKGAPDLSFAAKFILLSSFVASYNTAQYNEWQFSNETKKRRKRKKRRTAAPKSDPLQFGPSVFSIDMLRAVVCGLSASIAMSARSKAVLTDLRDFRSQLSQLVAMSLVTVTNNDTVYNDWKLRCNLTVDDAIELAKLYSFDIKTFLASAQ